MLRRAVDAIRGTRRQTDNIRLALEAAKGKIYGSNGAAAILRMKPNTLASRIKALGIGTP